LPLYSDDIVLRLVARSEGVSAFGTFSLLEVLAGKGQIGEDSFRDAIMSLRRNYAADLPFDAEQILTLAAEHGWRAGPGALPLTRPAFWQDPQRGFSLYQRCLEKVLRHDEMSLPGWCAAATLGFARSWPAALATRRAGRILAFTVLMSFVQSSGLRADLFSPMLKASRPAARNLGLDDTLPAAVEALKETMEETFGVSQAAPIFAKLVEGLDTEDRTVALQVFLRPPPA
jgi:hypothetical protein